MAYARLLKLVGLRLLGRPVRKGAALRIRASRCGFETFFFFLSFLIEGLIIILSSISIIASIISRPFARPPSYDCRSCAERDWLARPTYAPTARTRTLKTRDNLLCLNRK